MLLCSAVYCDPKCINGRCTGAQTCTCNPGWIGAHCDIGEPTCRQATINSHTHTYAHTCTHMHVRTHTHTHTHTMVRTPISLVQRPISIGLIKDPIMPLLSEDILNGKKAARKKYGAAQSNPGPLAYCGWSTAIYRKQIALGCIAGVMYPWL